MQKFVYYLEYSSMFCKLDLFFQEAHAVAHAVAQAVVHENYSKTDKGVPREGGGGSHPR